MKTETMKELDKLIAVAYGKLESKKTPIFGNLVLYLGSNVVDKIKEDQKKLTSVIHTIGLEKNPTIMGCRFVIDRKAHPNYYGLQPWSR